MDSQVSDSVGHVDRQTTWTDAVFASLRPSGHQVSADEIFEILNAASDGETLADRCAAKRVTVPIYCVWKAKYRHLSLEELRQVRRREHWRARSVLGVLLAAAVLGAAGIVFGLARAAQANITGAAAQTPADVTADRHADVPADLKFRATYAEAEARIAPVADHPRDKVDAPSTTPPVEHRAAADALPPPTDPGFKVQVGAAPTVQEGRVLMERLAAAGYPAYLFRAVVRDVEVFRVRVGPFDTLAAAEEVASQLQRDGFNGAWVVR